MTTHNNKDPLNKQRFTRRQFIKSTAAGVAGIYLAPSLALVADAASSGMKSRVVNISHANMINQDDQIIIRNARQTVDQALLMLTQKKNIKDAWMQVFPDLKTKDTIGLKVNGINRKCPTHPQIAYSIANSMIDSLGIDPNNIIIWDRSSSELEKAGYTINESEKNIRCFGTVDSFSIARWILTMKQNEDDGIGYDKKIPIDMGDGQISHLSRILTGMCTYLVNVPVLKDHSEAGVTLSLKNHYGTIDNPRDYHSNFCDPFIGKIYAAPLIRDKTKLIICDAAFGIYDGGPLGAPQWKYNSILASIDPVALDYTGMQIINAERKHNDLDPVTKMAIHIQTAQSMGLGTCNPDNIQVIESVLR